MKVYFKIVLITLSIIFSVAIEAQNAGNRNINTEVGLSAGISFYFGELNPVTPFHCPRFTGGLFIRQNINKRIALRGSLNYANLFAADSISGELPSRDGWFNTQILTTNLFCEINFLPFYIGAKREYITPYIIGGGGFTFPLTHHGSFHDSRGSTIIIQNENIGLDYQNGLIGVNNKVSIQLAFGVGLKYSFSKYIGMHAEWVFYRQFTDWIDGMYYYNYDDFLDNEMFVPIEEQQDGYPFFNENNILYICNSDNPDYHSFVEVGFSFSFQLFRKDDCKEQRQLR
ncbi:MAG: DUF6089 family protein [Bacteroidales bacterium]|jgi:hypothetical protein